MPLAPVSTQAIDFAASTIFLKSSAEASAGLGAPFWIATAMPERASGVHHADRLADATGLRQLEVDAVRPLGADGDVGKRVAILVDVDRDG